MPKVIFESFHYLVQGFKEYVVEFFSDSSLEIMNSLEQVLSLTFFKCHERKKRKRISLGIRVVY